MTTCCEHQHACACEGRGWGVNHELRAPNNVLKIIVEPIGQPEVDRDLFEIVSVRHHIEHRTRDVRVVEAALK